MINTHSACSRQQIGERDKEIEKLRVQVSRQHDLKKQVEEQNAAAKEGR